MMATGQGPLILGSTGRVGRALARVWDGPALWQHRAPAGPPADPSVIWDILHAPAPDVAGVTGIVLLAGATGGDALAQTTPLALAACDLGDALEVPVLIASSQAVYGPVTGPVTEETPCQPASDYARAKYAMEQAVAGRATCLRIGNVVGCDALWGNAATGAVTLPQMESGPRRNWITAQTLNQVITGLLAHDGPLPHVLNTASPGALDMATLMQAAGVAITWRDATPGDLPALDLDVTRLTGLVPLPAADPATLVAQARAAGWGAA